MRPSAEFYGEFTGEVRFFDPTFSFRENGEKHDRKLWSQIKAVLALRRLDSEINAKNGKIFRFSNLTPMLCVLARNFMANSLVKSVFSIRLLVFEKMAKNMIVSCDLKSRPFWRYDA